LSALNKGVDFILNYRKSHIDKEFFEKNKHILSQKKGDGYWLWKPYFILKTLENAPENSTVIYSRINHGGVFRSVFKCFKNKIGFPKPIAVPLFLGKDMLVFLKKFFINVGFSII